MFIEMSCYNTAFEWKRFFSWEKKEKFHPWKRNVFTFSFFTCQDEWKHFSFKAEIFLSEWNIHRLNSSFHVSSWGKEKHFSRVDLIENIHTLFSVSCTDLVSNQFLYRLVHHSSLHLLPDVSSMTGTHLVAFHCSNVEKSHLRITSKMNKLFTVFWPLTLHQISSFIGWKHFFCPLTLKTCRTHTEPLLH